MAERETREMRRNTRNISKISRVSRSLFDISSARPQNPARSAVFSFQLELLHFQLKTEN
jgi:hypothetical protein